MKKSLLSLVAVSALVTSAVANDVRLNGFASAVAGQNLDTDEIASYQGYDGHLRFQPDSVIGVQISGKVSDNMSATAQLIGRFDSTNSDGTQSAEIDVEWAYINYDLTEEATIQLGRFRPNVYLYSNTLDVGYSYLWIKPPSEMYFQVPMTYADGANLLYAHTFDNDMSIGASVYYASTQQTAAGFPADFSKQYGAELTLSNDYFKVRAGYTGTLMTFDLSSAGITNAAPSGLQAKDTDASFLSAGISADYMDVIFIAEYAMRNIQDTLFPEDSTSYYATLGYRIGNFTPNVTYAATDSEIKKEATNTGNPVVDGTNAVINGTRLTQADDKDSVSLGLRYDVNAMADIKVEYKMLNESNSLGENTKSSSLARVSLDIIF